MAYTLMFYGLLPDFCGVYSGNRVPDGDTIGQFRNLLIESKPDHKQFEQAAELPEARCLLLRRGIIVDSALIAAPPSTRNRNRDAEAHQVKKENA